MPVCITLSTCSAYVQDWFCPVDNVSRHVHSPAGRQPVDPHLETDLNPKSLVWTVAWVSGVRQVWEPIELMRTCFWCSV